MGITHDGIFGAIVSRNRLASHETEEDDTEQKTAVRCVGLSPESVRAHSCGCILHYYEHVCKL